MAYYGGSNNFMSYLTNYGVTDVIVPFFLIFTLVFAVLQKTNILGQDKKNLNAVLALVMGLTVIIPHSTGRYSMGYDPVDIINAFLPSVSLLIVAFVMLLLLIGVWGGDARWAGGSPSAMIALLSAIAIVWIFGSAAGWWQGWNWFNSRFGSDTISLIIILLVFGVVIWFITKTDKTSPGAGFFDKFGDMFKKI